MTKGGNATLLSLLIDNNIVNKNTGLLLLQTNNNNVEAQQDRAEVNIRVSGACGTAYLSRRGIDPAKYRPKIRFSPDQILLTPKNPTIPGCIKIKALGVEVIRPVRNLVAEIEMRIGGIPDPTYPTLPCSEKVNSKINQCPCGRLENTCVFCDFCKQMRNQTTRHGSSHAQTIQKLIDNDCLCEVMQPGFYDIETEMCTPELDDVKEYIPPEIEKNIVEKRPISMFITVYLMDYEQNGKESYISEFGKALLRRRMTQNTIACFLMGIDVKIA
uniref:Bm2391 n=1 Tax=Brugia malayi TaxID=6279 RepID=A0A0J9Y910_BRUMA|nr:Bm2391 [Brugia malayi]